MKFKIFSVLFLVIYSAGIQAQKIGIASNLKIIYDGKLQLGKAFSKNQLFVTVGSGSDYYFAGFQNYLNDTGQYQADGIDFQSISDYFQERISYGCQRKYYIY